ncbi:MAG: Na+/H+ antiporter subunit D [Acidimicrobiia bacterium]|nr:Na+/H+ antiporter subunit D [Acidimicrobiia bacterium]
MKVLVPLPVVLPLLAAGLSMALSRRVALQRVVGVVALGATLAVCIALLVRVEADGIAAVQLGGWPAPLGITLVADLFACILLVISMTTVLAVLVFAIGHPGSEDTSAIFHPVYLVLTAGVAASFLTGDLFNLFVAFEVMLSASYVLITLGGRRDQVRTGMTYVVISLTASALFITALGLVYASTGTVNMADLAGRLAELPDATRTAIGLLFLVVFGVKAAIFPLFFWLPDSYPTAPSPVTAIFAGLLTKVGVYAIIRSQTLLFPLEGATETLVLVIAGITMLVGVLGAIAQNDIKRILSFHIISQIGYMIMGLGLFTVAGVAASIVYMVHHIPVKTSLFLVDGMVETGTGTGALARLGGLVRRMPAVAVLFFLPAMSLAGIPPFSGFVGKLALAESGFSARQYAIVAVSLATSLLTLFSMTKVWNGAFWGGREPRAAGGAHEGEERIRSPRLMLGATAGLVAVTLAVAVSARPLLDLSERAARSLLDPAPYVEAVLG